jgi:hypothetical protein
VTGYLGGCDPAYACAYINTTSWANATTPLPMEINPRTMFERLFGRAGTAAQRLAAQQTDRSILDSVREDVRELQSGLGRRDQGRLSEYLDNVREIEQRIQRAEKQNATSVTVPDAPVGIPETFSEHMMLMFDLLAVAWQADMTRVFSYMLNRDVSQRVYPEINVSEPHHAMSHHGKDARKLSDLVKLNTWQVSLFARFVERLKNTPDGDGSLLESLGDLLGQRHERERSALPPRRTHAARGQGQRALQGQPAPGGAGGNADRQLPGGHRPEVRRRGRSHGSQHRPAGGRVATGRLPGRAMPPMRFTSLPVAVMAALLTAAPALAADPGADVLTAARNGDREGLRALVKKRADVNAAEADGTTALHWAIRAQDAVSVATLIARAPTSTPPTGTR